jgi:hypothetical protein
MADESIIITEKDIAQAEQARKDQVADFFSTVKKIAENTELDPNELGMATAFLLGNRTLQTNLAISPISPGDLTSSYYVELVQKDLDSAAKTDNAPNTSLWSPSTLLLKEWLSSATVDSGTSLREALASLPPNSSNIEE